MYLRKISLKLSTKKKPVIAIVFMMISTIVYSQKSSLSEEWIERLKTQTAVLVLPATEYAYLDDYKKLVPQAWTITPIEVIKYSELPNYADIDKYAFFNITGLQRSSNKGGSATYYTLVLSSYAVKTKRGKEKVEPYNLCRIELSPEFAAIPAFRKKDATDILYQTITFRNFTLPYMLSYLKFVQKNITNKTNPPETNEYSDDALLSRLAGDTLYIPDDVAFDRNKFNGDEKIKEAGFFSAYNGRYKIISRADLINLIKTRNPKKPLFVFEYVLSSTDKYVSVHEVNSGTIVYRKYTGPSYTLKDKDMERILK